MSDEREKTLEKLRALVSGPLDDSFHGLAANIRATKVVIALQFALGDELDDVPTYDQLRDRLVQRVAELRATWDGRDKTAMGDAVLRPFRALQDVYDAGETSGRAHERADELRRLHDLRETALRMRTARAYAAGWNACAAALEAKP